MGNLQLFDLGTGSARTFPLAGVNAHAVAANPARPAILVTFGQDSPVATVTDTKDGSQLAVLKCPDGIWGSGHGAFSTKGDRLYVPEFPKEKTREGSVAVYDTANWKLERRYASGAVQPSDILLLADGETLAVGHYGQVQDNAPMRGGSLVFINAASGKQIRKVDAADSLHSLCHIARDSRDRLVVSTRAWVTHGKNPDGSWNEDHYPTPLMFSGAGAADWQERFPEKFREKMRFNFSLYIDEPGERVFVVHVTSGILSVWSLGDGRLLKEINFDGEKLMGVARAGAAIVVNCMSNKLFVLDGKSLRRIDTVNLAAAGLGPGPHLTYLPA